MKVKKLLFLVAILTLGVVLYRPITENSSSLSPSPKPSLSQSSSLRIDYGEGRIVENVITVASEASVLESLRNLHEVQIKEFDFGKLVEVIDGVKSGDGIYWIYYVNGTMGQVGANQYRLKPGDKIEWKLEKEKK